MKKLFFGLAATVLLAVNANAQRPSLSSIKCDVGQHAVISFEFNCMKLHRASTGCERRFSICSDGDWLIDCVDNNLSKLSSFNPKDNKALVVGEVSVDGKSITLHFPIALKNASHFVADDFKNFGFDEDYTISEDLILSKGEYIPTFTKDEILVKVNLK